MPLLLWHFNLKAQNSGNIESTATEAVKVIERVPIYPGCENQDTSANLKRCLSQKISKHFTDNFNTTLHSDSQLAPDTYRINIIFKINSEGKIVTIRVRGRDRFLEEEAIRVAKLLPKMQPGTKNGVLVAVPYSVPLLLNMFSAGKSINENVSVYQRFRGCDENLSYEEAKSCSERKIMNFIKLNFDIEMASAVLPLKKSTKFQLEFIINTKGKIEQVNAQANHKAIAIEAIKVAKRLPKFKSPGYADGTAVNTPFKLLMTLYF